MREHLSSFLAAAGRRIAKEVAYTVVVAVVLLCAYQAVSMVFTHQRRDRYIERAKRAIADLEVMVPGKRLTAHGIDLVEHPFSLFVITSPDCVFCVNSAGFHRTLVSAARGRAIPVFLVLPGAKEAVAFLSASGLQGAEVLNWSDLDLRAQGTPAVALVDSKGTVRKVWLGELSQTGRSEVLEALQDPSHVSPPLRRLTSGEALLTPEDVRLLSSVRTLTILSIEERDSFKREHSARAINIPFEELGPRAPSELHRDRLYVVDCSTAVDAVCSAAVGRLNGLGFHASAADFGSLGEGK